MRQRISRRAFVGGGIAGLGMAVMPSSLLAREAVAPASPQAGSSAARDHALAQLVTPIAVGTQLGSANVAAIGVDARGVGVVTLTDRHGRRCDAEVARRTDEDAGPNPLAQSRVYSLSLRNGGNGHTPTDEGFGRAVLAIAERVRRNEDAVAGLALASRAEIWASAVVKA